MGLNLIFFQSKIEKRSLSQGRSQDFFYRLRQTKKFSKKKFYFLFKS